MTFMDDFDGTDENNPDRIRPEFRALVARGNVTRAELEEIRCNSWEWELLVPVLTDQAFVEQMQRALDNCYTTRERPFATYNQAIEGLYAPELLRRFGAEARAATEFAGVIDSVREALGQESTHYLIVAGDVKELVQAVERGGDSPALETLKRLRVQGDPPECPDCGAWHVAPGACPHREAKT